MYENRHYSQRIPSRKSSNKSSEFTGNYNSRRRAETEAYENMENYPRRKKLVQSSVFLPFIQSKQKNGSFHERRNSNPYEFKGKNLQTDESEDQTMQCLQQCQKILDNLRKLTRASYKKEKRKQERQYELAEEEEQLQTIRKNKRANLRSPVPEKDFFQRMPEPSSKYENSRAKQRYENYLSSPVISIESSPMQIKKNPRAENSRMESQNNQRKLNQNSRRQSIPDKQFESRLSLFEEEQENNELSKNNQKDEPNKGKQIIKVNQNKNETAEQDKKKGENDQKGCNETNQHKQQSQNKQQIFNQEENKPKEIQQDNKGQESGNQNQKISSIQKQKTLLKYLMRAKDKGNILNTKVTTFNKKHNKRSVTTQQQNIVDQTDQTQENKEDQECKEITEEKSKQNEGQKQIVRATDNKVEESVPKLAEGGLNIVEIDGETGDIIKNVQEYQRKRAIRMENPQFYS